MEILERIFENVFFGLITAIVVPGIIYLLRKKLFYIIKTTFRDRYNNKVIVKAAKRDRFSEIGTMSFTIITFIVLVTLFLIVKAQTKFEKTFNEINIYAQINDSLYSLVENGETINQSYDSLYSQYFSKMTHVSKSNKDLNTTATIVKSKDTIKKYKILAIFIIVIMYIGLFLIFILFSYMTLLHLEFKVRNDLICDFDWKINLLKYKVDSEEIAKLEYDWLKMDDIDCYKELCKKVDELINSNK